MSIKQEDTNQKIREYLEFIYVTTASPDLNPLLDTNQAHLVYIMIGKLIKRYLQDFEEELNYKLPLEEEEDGN